MIELTVAILCCVVAFKIIYPKFSLASWSGGGPWGVDDPVEKEFRIICVWAAQQVIMCFHDGDRAAIVFFWCETL